MSTRTLAVHTHSARRLGTHSAPCPVLPGSSSCSPSPPAVPFPFTFSSPCPPWSAGRSGSRGLIFLHLANVASMLMPHGPAVLQGTVPSHLLRAQVPSSAHLLVGTSLILQCSRREQCHHMDLPVSLGTPAPAPWAMQCGGDSWAARWLCWQRFQEPKQGFKKHASATAHPLGAAVNLQVLAFTSLRGSRCSPSCSHSPHSAQGAAPGVVPLHCLLPRPPATGVSHLPSPPAPSSDHENTQLPLRSAA